MREVVSEFIFKSLESCFFYGACIVSLSLILCMMCLGFYASCILPFGIWCLSACSVTLVSVMFAMCG